MACNKKFLDSELPMVESYRRMTADEFDAAWLKELDFLEYLKGTKRHPDRINKQLRRIEIITMLAAE